MSETIIIPRSKPWYPTTLRKSDRPSRYRSSFSDPERKVFRKNKRIPVSRWCEQYRYVTMSVLPGKWKNDVTPYLPGIMDASFFPSVQTIIVCKSPQVGGTEGMLNCLAYAIDRDPGPVLCIYPDELTARENSQDRILPMIENSPRLRSYLTGQEDDSSMLRINLQHMPIYMAWARSAARLANKPIRYVLFDEVDKYADTAGRREADPISLGEARTTTYRYNRKIWKVSTPTTETGNIWKALTKEAQAIFDYWAQCPACGVHQRMIFKQIKWPHDAEPGTDGKFHSKDPADIEAGCLAWYECPHCLFQWNDYDRDNAVRHGRWQDRETGVVLQQYLEDRHPAKIGFHLPSWNSPFVSLSEVAATFLRGLSDVNKFKDFHNKHLAEPWKLTVISGDESQILSARCSLPAQVVSPAAIALTCGIDVQEHGFWFAVRAWAPYLTSWLIHYGFLSTWEEVESLLYNTAYPVQGTDRPPLPIIRAAVDTGGGKKFETMTMTEETYFWLIKNRGRGGVGLWGTKGASSALPLMLKLGEAIMTTPSGKKLTGGLRLLTIDTEKAKDQYHYRLRLASKPETRDLPGAALLHADTGSDYVAQILAEEKQKNEQGHEEWVNIHQRPNHLLDAEVLAAVCVEMEFPGGSLRLMAENMKNRAAQAQPEERKSGSFVGNRRGGWISGEARR